MARGKRPKRVGRQGSRGRPAKVRLDVRLSEEATDLLERITAVYSVSKSRVADEAIKFWGKYGKQYGLDGHFQPLCPPPRSPSVRHLRLVPQTEPPRDEHEQGETGSQ